MNPEILKAHALVAQKKLPMADFEAFLLGLLAGKRKVNYKTYILSPEWKAKADVAKKRAGHRCQVCNKGPKDGVRLEAHHRTYENLGNEKPGDITVLCEDCHELFSRRK